MPITNSHQWAFLPGDRYFFGQGFAVRNAGSSLLLKNNCVLFSISAQTTTLDTYVPVKAQAANTIDLKRRVAGMVYGRDIEPGETGIVAIFARVQSLLATGTVSAGDWLCLSGTRAGAARSCATASRTAFAIAHIAHSGSASGIEALLIPWRI